MWWVCHIPSSINCTELCLIVFIDSSFQVPHADRIKCQQQKQRCFIRCHNEQNWKHTHCDVFGTGSLDLLWSLMVTTECVLLLPFIPWKMRLVEERFFSPWRLPYPWDATSHTIATESAGSDPINIASLMMSSPARVWSGSPLPLLVLISLNCLSRDKSRAIAQTALKPHGHALPLYW